jgi:hypothetical protein
VRREIRVVGGGWRVIWNSGDGHFGWWEGGAGDLEFG